MKITSFTATPSAIGNTGGTVSLAAGTQGVTTCTFSVLPSLVGLPTSMGCQNGLANKQVTIPANPGIARKFTFTITASNGNDHVSKTAVVTQAATLNFLSISAGFEHTCGVVTNHTVRCWGANDVGQLGNGSTTRSAIPVAVSGLVGVKAVSTGTSESCALLTGGTVKCWGFNWYGGLGDGSRTQSTTPVAVSGLVGVKAVSTGNLFSCALLTGGTVTCWGNNNSGQLGNGQNNTFSTAPVAVSGLVGVTAIEASSAGYTCARLTAGTVKCWGANDFGELGNQSPVDVLTPTTVSGLAGVTAITARQGHQTCARLTAGTAKCWGANDVGQLGNGTTIDSITPVAVSGLVGVTAISAGQRHTCAFLAGGTAYCWGYNFRGQLGDGTTTDSTTPVAVSGLLGVTAISAGAEHTCALVTGGKAYCWGNNFEGDLGDGTRQNRSTPVAVSPF
jgi:alpha-tubulin suppressor-like RCC1 family protein